MQFLRTKTPYSILVSGSSRWNSLPDGLYPFSLAATWFPFLGIFSIPVKKNCLQRGKYYNMVPFFADILSDDRS